MIPLRHRLMAPLLSTLTFVVLWAILGPGIETIKAAEVPRTPEEHAKIAKSLEDLTSKDLMVRTKAIGELGHWKRDDITDTLIELLRRQLEDEEAWKSGTVCTQVGKMRVYLAVGPENLVIVLALAQQQAVQSLPILRAVHAHCLNHVSADRRQITSWLAPAIYSLSGEIVDVSEGKASKKYEPSPSQKEQMRMFVRPDLLPVGGLTAKLDIPATSDYSIGLLGSKPCRVLLTLTNTSENPVPVDLSSGSFALWVPKSGEYKTLSMSELPAPIGDVMIKELAAGKSATIEWQVNELKSSVLGEAMGRYLKMVYSPQGERVKREWTATELQSNTLDRHYFPND